MSTMGPFAKSIMEQKYSWDIDGKKETWEEIAHRVATNVMGAVNAPQNLVKKIERMIADRKFMPGGRYNYASGRDYHQCQNCLLLSVEDTREGWADLISKCTTALMTGAGIGVVYSKLRPNGSLIKRTGGVASGPIALMQMVNEISRGVRQGGSRRGAIWAGLHWNHEDIMDFIATKNWSKDIMAMKEKDYNYPAPLDGTNISVILDDNFFTAINDTTHPQYSLAQKVYWTTVKQMLKTGEPGFSINIGPNQGENLRNAPVCSETNVLTCDGYVPVGSIVGIPTTLWTGKQWAPNVVFKKTATNTCVVKVSFTGGRSICCDPSHEFMVERYTNKGQKRRLNSIDRVRADCLKKDDILHVSLPKVGPTDLDRTSYTLGLVYGDGSFCKNRNAEITLCTDNKKSLTQFLDYSLVSSITKNDIRGYDRVYFGANKFWENRSKDHVPQDLIDSIQKASFIAGLFDADGNVSPERSTLRLSANSPTFLREVARMLEELGILAGVSRNGNSTYGNKQTYQLVVMSDYTNAFLKTIPTRRLSLSLRSRSYRKSVLKVSEVIPYGTADVYCADVNVPEHSFMAEGVIISNCTEVSGYDDSDICNLGSINMARVSSLEEMKELVELGTAFLLAGSVYSDVPYEKIREIRSKNRRLGLGLLGLHEWLLIHGISQDILHFWRVCPKVFKAVESICSN
jgi:ribonucleotide reductase alpha subunit